MYSQHLCEWEAATGKSCLLSPWEHHLGCIRVGATLFWWGAQRLPERVLPWEPWDYKEAGFSGEGHLFLLSPTDCLRLCFENQHSGWPR